MRVSSFAIFILFMICCKNINSIPPTQSNSNPMSNVSTIKKDPVIPTQKDSDLNQNLNSPTTTIQSVKTPDNKSISNINNQNLIKKISYIDSSHGVDPTSDSKPCEESGTLFLNSEFLGDWNSKMCLLKNWFYAPFSYSGWENVRSGNQFAIISNTKNDKSVNLIFVQIIYFPLSYLSYTSEDYISRCSTFNFPHDIDTYSDENAVWVNFKRGENSTLDCSKSTSMKLKIGSEFPPKNLILEDGTLIPFVNFVRPN